MQHIKLSHKKTSALCTALFLIGLALVSFFDYWWPGIMLVVGIPLAVRQYFHCKLYDTAITLIVFLGVYVTVQFHIPWKLLLPVLFVIGAIYIFFRDYVESKEESEVEHEEDLNEEIEEDQDKEHKK